MRTVSFIGPEEGRSGAGITEAFTGADGGGGGGKKGGEVTSGIAGFETGSGSGETRTGSGSRSGNWIRTVSRDFVFSPAWFPGGGGAKGIRVVSFFGSFGSAIERNKSGKVSSKNKALSPGKYNPAKNISPSLPTQANRS
jgi:hypothetical protein